MNVARRCCARQSRLISFDRAYAGAPIEALSASKSRAEQRRQRDRLALFRSGSEELYFTHATPPIYSDRAHDSVASAAGLCCGCYAVLQARIPRFGVGVHERPVARACRRACSPRRTEHLGLSSTPRRTRWLASSQQLPGQSGLQRLRRVSPSLFACCPDVAERRRASRHTKLLAVFPDVPTAVRSRATHTSSASRGRLITAEASFRPGPPDSSIL